MAVPLQPPPDRLRDFYFAGTQRLLGGLVRFHPGAGLFVGPVPLIRLADPTAIPGGWAWAITGGILSMPGGGGRVEITWTQGTAQIGVLDWRPALPRPLYWVTQAPFHHFITRLLLLRLRGPLPAPGTPAPVAERWAAGALDVAACLLGARLLRAGPGATVALAAGYHLAGWRFGGRTLGGALFGLRLTAVDGSRVTAGQAALRLALLPLAALRLRAVHDEASGTQVVLQR